MEKISVIIPTMLVNTKVLNKLLKILNKDQCVDEILLINNSNKEFKCSNEIDKLKIYPQEVNLLVNPSWNLGVKLIKNDIFLIINDDILCPKNFCSIIVSSGILDKPDTGLVGLKVNNINNYTKEEVKDIPVPPVDKNYIVSFEPLENHLCVGNWGSAFFGRKKNYHEIPEIFKVIYGDNYLLKANKDNNKINYSICGLNYNHIASSSSQLDEVSQYVCDDVNNALKYFGSL